MADSESNLLSNLIEEKISAAASRMRHGSASVIGELFLNYGRTDINEVFQ